MSRKFRVQKANLNEIIKLLSEMREKGINFNQFRFEKLCSEETKNNIKKAVNKLKQLEPKLDASDITHIIFWDFLSSPRRIRYILKKNTNPSGKVATE